MAELGIKVLSDIPALRGLSHLVQDRLLSELRAAHAPKGSLLSLPDRPQDQSVILLTGTVLPHFSAATVGRPRNCPGGVIGRWSRAANGCLAGFSMFSSGTLLLIPDRVVSELGLDEPFLRSAIVPGNRTYKAPNSAHDILVASEMISGRVFGATLELGCGGGRFSTLLANCSEHLTLVDLDSSALQSAMALLEWLRIPTGRSTVVADMSVLPFSSGSFELVASRLALHEVEDIGLVLAECRRVLVDGGVLLISDVSPPGNLAGQELFCRLEETLSGSGSNIRSDKEWKGLLRDAGFRLEDCRSTNQHRLASQRPGGLQSLSDCQRTLLCSSSEARAALDVDFSSPGDPSWKDRRTVWLARAA